VALWDVKAVLGEAVGHWDMVMGRKGQKFLTHLAISAVAAIATPAVAAGLLAGASAGTEALGNTIYSTDSGAAGSADVESQTATRAPTKLSVLAGNDKEAWASVRAVHVDFHRHPK
jgi:hypothetical protein